MWGLLGCRTLGRWFCFRLLGCAQDVPGTWGSGKGGVLRPTGLRSHETLGARGLRLWGIWEGEELRPQTQSYKKFRVERHRCQSHRRPRDMGIT